MARVCSYLGTVTTKKNICYDENEPCVQNIHLLIFSRFDSEHSLHIYIYIYRGREESIGVLIT